MQRYQGYEEPIGWVKKTQILFDIFLMGFKLTVQFLLLGLFWAVIIPSFMNKDFFIKPHQGELIRGIIGMCIKPPIGDLTRSVVTVIVFNLMFTLILRYGRLKVTSYHIMSFITGGFVLLINSSPRNLLLILGFLFVILLLVKRAKCLLESDSEIKHPIYVISITLMLLLFLGELFLPNRQNWQESRGVMIIMAMKVISLSSKGSVMHSITYTELFGYLFCPATILFGPWITIDHYRLNYVYQPKLNWKWPVKIVQLLINAMIFMTLSNCTSRNFIPAGEHPLGRIWFEAFRNAFVFRAGNYFICYMGEFTLITAGFNTLNRQPGGNWQFTVCHPFFVEFPRSIATFARNWNVPVYSFLKDHIYAPCASINRVYAVISTFFVSVLLLGMNIRIMVILISLGVLSNAQKVVQNWLSNRLSSCCKINPCSNGCNHICGRFHPITMIINGGNLVLNMIHLAYLGYIMNEKFEDSSFMDLYFTWNKDLDLFTHHVILFWVGNMMFLL